MYCHKTYLILEEVLTVHIFHLISERYRQSVILKKKLLSIIGYIISKEIETRAHGAQDPSYYIHNFSHCF